MRSIRMITLILAWLPLAIQAEPSNSSWPYVEKKLKRAGLQKSFIKALHDNYESQDFKTVTELNCLLFLRKTDDHGVQVSPEAVDKVKSFIAQNRTTFEAVEQRYGVTPSVIAGLLWIESRFGENIGRYHVMSAFVNLLAADQPAVIRSLQQAAVPKYTDKMSAKNRRLIAAKAKQKGKWAIAELKALQALHKKDAKAVVALRGSFAGAFGWPQFEPSSFEHFARSSGTETPDLNQAADAIHSVANYLRESGWRRGRPKTYEKALLMYNHSHDYARAILKLAWQADGLDPGRIPASLTKKKAKKNR